MSPQPFDAERYQRLMDGLECSEVLYSDIRCSDILRCDSEYFSKIATNTEKLIAHMEHFFLKSKEVVSGPFGSTLKSSAYMDIGDVPFVRIENIKGGFHINKDNMVYISDEDNQLISNSELHIDDIVLSKVGNSIGFFARIDDTIKHCNISENNIGIKLSKYDMKQRHYILTYLNSRYGQILLLRRKSGNAQPKLNVNDICYIPIPKFSERFQHMVSNFIQLSDKLHFYTSSAYTSAEKLLLSSLNLDKFTSSTENTSVKSFSQVDQNERMDAEYYQKKYDDLFAAMCQSRENLNVLKVVRMADIVSIKKSIEPGSDAYSEEGIPFLRVADISKYELQDTRIFLERHTFDLETLKPKKDTILLSKDGTVGIAYKVDSDMDIITSGALLHLTVTDPMVNPDYLTLVLNSFIVGMQAERDVGGSVIKHWRIDEIKKVQIPLLEISIQKEIAQKVRQSFDFRERSKALLKAATRAVEIAIEQDESAAMAYLKEQTKGDA